MAKIDITNYKAADFIKELPQTVQQLDAFRGGNNVRKPINISLGELVENRYGLSEDAYFEKLGINPKVDTISNIFTMPDQNIRWIVPEIIREAINLGIDQAPFYPNVIASDQPISGLSAIMPFINPSDAAPAKVNEAETIPLGTVSFGQKSVRLFKIGKGFKLTYEVRDYVSLDVMSIFLRDFGIQLGYALDSLCMDTLVNGNQADGSESAATIGVDTVGSVTYRDLLRIWVRASRMGRVFSTMIGGETMAMDILDLPEFKLRMQGTTAATLNLKTPVPNSADFYIHSGVEDDQVLLVDKRSAIIKLTARQLMLESEKIVSNQTEAVYATLTTGFSKMYQDASIILDSSVAFTSNGFPEYMDVDKFLDINLEH